jgi:uncharacterized Zn-binding protein involved in type VI secretion
MGQPAAKQNDQIQAIDTHMVIVPNSSPLLLPHVFNGVINNGLSADVRINGLRAATVGSTAANTPHIPQAPGASFQRAPSNIGTIRFGSQSVRINGNAAARNGDAAETCNDPADALVGRVIAQSNVRIG